MRKIALATVLVLLIIAALASCDTGSATTVTAPQNTTTVTTTQTAATTITQSAVTVSTTATVTQAGVSQPPASTTSLLVTTSTFPPVSTARGFVSGFIESYGGGHMRVSGVNIEINSLITVVVLANGQTVLPSALSVGYRVEVHYDPNSRVASRIIILG